MNAVCLLSGGLDSSTLVADLLEHGHGVVALSVHYGQCHRRELDAAAVIATHYDVEHEVVDLSALREAGLFAGSALTDDSVPVPHGHYEAPTMKTTVVPNRNMLLLSVAAALAIARGLDAIAYAAHAGDHAVYPDCRPEFIEAMSAALALCDYRKLELHTPFAHGDKAAIVARAHALGVPLGKTWSCYEGGVHHCGQCGTCVERKQAFAKADVADPTEYLA